MKVNQNISAVISNARLHQTENRMTASTERLASGFKLNHAKDSPSGMAISNKMRAQINALNQASSNSADGISVMQTADGALEETTAILQRIRELSVQAASDTMNTTDKQACQQEIDELLQEIDRIASDTEFNGKKILDGSQDRRVYSDTKGISNFYSTTEVADGIYEFELISPPQKASLEVSMDDIYDYVSTELAAGRTPEVAINGVLVEISADREELYQNIREEAEIYGAIATRSIDTSVTPNVEMVRFEAVKAGSAERLDFFLGTKQYPVTAANKGRDAEIKINPTDDGFASTATVYAKGDKVTITDLNGFELSFVIDETIKVNEDKKAIKPTVSTVSTGPVTTTGKASDITATTEPIIGKPATAGILGVTFVAQNAGTTADPYVNGNGYSVELKGIANASASSDKAVFDTSTGKLTISLSEETINSVTTASDLNSKIGELLASGTKSYISDGTTETAGAITQINTEVPVGSASAADITSNLRDLVDDDHPRTMKTDLLGAVDGKAGVYTFELEEAFSEKNDSIVVGGYTFRAVAASDTPPTATDGTFRLGTVADPIDKDTQGTDIAAALQAALQKQTSTNGATATYSAGTITITEIDTQAGNLTLSNEVTERGYGYDEVFTITDELGQEIQVVLEKNTDDTLQVEYTAKTGTQETGTLTIRLADTTSSKNTPDAIQAAIRMLDNTHNKVTDGTPEAGTAVAADSVDFSKFTVISGEPDNSKFKSGIVKLDVTNMGQMNFQVGAHEDQIVSAKLSAATTAAMYIDDINVVRVGAAEQAITAVDDALAYINKLRGAIGAYQNRLEHAESSLDETSENMEAAISRVLDTDMAEEMSEYANLQVLDQAAISVLGQANDMPQNILQLLGN